MMYNGKVNTRVTIWIIHIQLKYFWWEKKLFSGQEKNRYVEN